MKRFHELKVGDQVTFLYYESVVYAVQKPGAQPTAQGGAAITRGTGPKRGGTIAQQMTAVVTVKAIDTKVPSVIVNKSRAQRS